MKTFFLLMVVMATMEQVKSYVCQTRTLHAKNEMKDFTSPYFPRPFPDGPYNCTYIIDNLNGGTVTLRFTDFVTHEMFSYGYDCREKISIYKRNSSGVDMLQTEECGNFFNIFHDSGTTSTLIVRYEVTGKNLLKIPGFRATYWATEYLPYTDPFRLYGYFYFNIRPYSDGFYYGHQIRENRTTINVDVLKAVPGHQLALAPPHVPDHNITHPISLEIRDGITSQAPLLRQVTNLTDLTTVLSTSGYLHITLMMDKLYHDYSDSWVSILRSRQRCPTGYYKCASSDVCVGISAVCDGYDHCGDNSDEIHSSLNCSIKRLCSAEPPYGCLSERGDCYNYSYLNKVYCNCEYGYSGDKCEYEIQGCDWQCQHDGTCIDYRCECGFLSGAYGDFCEHVHECDPDCQHGATCSRYSNTCYCTSEYYGDRCEYKYEYGDDSSPDSGLITILIPLVVIFVVFTGCIVCLKRSRCGQQAAANDTSTTIVTAAQVTYVNNETNLPPFTDSPPSYADAVPAASDSPDGAFLEGHDPCDDQLTPPPKYETVVSPLANVVYRGNSNTDLQRDQTEQSAPAGDGNQTV